METLRNAFNVGPGGDVFQASANAGSLAFAGAKVLGHMLGKTQMMSAIDILDVGRNFIYTEVLTTGSTTKAVQAPTATLPAVLKLTTGTTQHDNCQLQWAKGQTANATAAGTATAFAPFLIKASPLVAGDRSGSIHFMARISPVTTINNIALFVGLSVVSTTMLSSSTLNASDMVGFFKAAGAATIAGSIRGASTTTSTVLNSNTLVAGSWYDVELYINERGSVTYWINGVKTGETTMTNLPANTVALCPSIAVSAGTAAAATLNIEAMACIQDGGF